VSVFKGRLLRAVPGYLNFAYKIAAGTPGSNRGDAVLGELDASLGIPCHIPPVIAPIAASLSPVFILNNDTEHNVE
jgi:hypothetical protein